MRDLTEQEKKEYRYKVLLNIDVKRTDNEVLTDEENKMVLDMQTASEAAIKKVMESYGSNKSKRLGSEMRAY